MTGRSMAVLMSMAVAVLAMCAKERAVTTSPKKAARPDSLQQQFDELRRTNDLQRQYIEDVTRTLNEVQDQLHDVAPLERDLTRLSVGVERGESIEQTQREKVLSKIETVKSALKADAQRLSELHARNAAFPGKIAGLEATVTRLQATIHDRNEEISRLQRSIVRMTDQVNTLRHEDAEHVQELERRQNVITQSAEDLQRTSAERDRAYILVGTVPALTKLGVLQERKRFLRKPVISLTAAPEMTAFQPIDSRQNREFEVAAAAAAVHLYPSRAQELYRLVPKTNGTSTLVIKDPERFWLTRFLVISMGE